MSNCFPSLPQFFLHMYVQLFPSLPPSLLPSLGTGACDRFVSGEVAGSPLWRACAPRRSQGLPAELAAHAERDTQ